RPTALGWYFKDPVTGRMASLAWSCDKRIPIGSGITQQQRVNARANRDYDSDGRDDVIVYRPSTGAWLIRASERGAAESIFTPRGGVPVTGDFTGDGLLEIGKFGPHPGDWSYYE